MMKLIFRLLMYLYPINRFTIFLCFVLLVSCYYNYDGNDQKKNKARLLYTTDTLADATFLNKIVDFGEVTGDTILTAKYILKSSGVHDLVINYVNPDCSCTNYSLSKDTIMPGDSAIILLEFSTKERLGPQKIYATVSTNTLDRFYKLILKVNILRNTCNIPGHRLHFFS